MQLSAQQYEHTELKLKDFMCEHGFMLIAGTVIVLITLTISSCQTKSKQFDTEQIKVYLDQGCKKETIAGTTGTHWVCNTD